MSLGLQAIGFRTPGLTDSGWRLGSSSLVLGSQLNLFSLKSLLVKFEVTRNIIYIFVYKFNTVFVSLSDSDAQFGSVKPRFHI
jgi:hypothetical protein